MTHDLLKLSDLKIRQVSFWCLRFKPRGPRCHHVQITSLGGWDRSVSRRKLHVASCCIMLHHVASCCTVSPGSLQTKQPNKHVKWRFSDVPTKPSVCPRHLRSRHASDITPPCWVTDSRGGCEAWRSRGCFRLRGKVVERRPWNRGAIETTFSSKIYSWPWRQKQDTADSNRGFWRTLSVCFFFVLVDTSYTIFYCYTMILATAMFFH